MRYFMREFYDNDLEYFNLFWEKRYVWATKLQTINLYNDEEMIKNSLGNDVQA